MMIIVGVIKQTGLFEYLGIWAAKKSQGRPYRLMVMFMIITAIASPVLDNVTIIMLVVPSRSSSATASTSRPSPTSSPRSWPRTSAVRRP